MLANPSPDYVAQALSALKGRNFQLARENIIAHAHSNPLELQHYMIKGLSEIALNMWGEAKETFEEASDFFPHQPQIWFNLGMAQENLLELHNAAESYEHALDLKRDDALACGNLSNIYRRLGRLEEAESLAHRAFELGAPRIEALNILGLALGKQGKFEGAEQNFKEALAMDGGNTHALANLANLYVDQLMFAKAWPLFEAARQLAPTNATIRRDEGMARLLAGDYAAGWPLYEARLDLPRALRINPACLRYKGEALINKRILLVAEQGLGDAIQFCRYGGLLTSMGAEVVWHVPASLKKLFAANLIGTVVAEGDEVPATDFYIPFMSLPYVLHKYAPADAPMAPYITRSGHDETTRPVLPNAKAKKRVGLVWRGSPTHERDHERSINLQTLAPLFRTFDAHYYAMFKGAGLEQSANWPITRLDNLLGDFSDTAALLQQLDCLITVDTAVAHLAGAMGVKTYLLLPHCPDWRWGVPAGGALGDATPWYPSLTVLRQLAYGDWDGVMQNLLTQLRQ